MTNSPHTHGSVSSDNNQNTHSCTSCGAPLIQGQSQCSRCGTTFGKQHTCSFCGVLAKAMRHKEFRFACPACGGPRLPPVGESATPDASIEPLALAKRAHSSRALWRVMAGIISVFTVVSLMTLIGAMTVIGFQLLPFLIGLLVVLVCGAFIPLGLIKAAGKTREIHQHMDDAWVHAVVQVAKERGSVRVSEIAEAFGLSMHAVEQLVARVGVSSDISTHVADDGQLVLSATVGNVRVQASEQQLLMPAKQEKIRVQQTEVPFVVSDARHEDEARLIAELEMLEAQSGEVSSRVRQ